MRALAAFLLLTAAACSDDGDGRTTVTVFAAASLTDAFTELAAEFEAANEGIAVELNVAGSSALREQILAGAPADVFVAADASTMEAVIDGGAAAEATDLVENRLQIVVPAGNPAGITGLADFADPDLLLGMCAEQVPCGRYGRDALTRAGVAPSVDTNEPDVRSLLTKVEAGELDAGIVYRTDVLSGGDAVEGVEIPADQNVVATYPIAALIDSGNPDAAAAFIAFVLAEEGLAILASYGFDESA